nr:hypothetical protein [Parabacteroides goldsteinii]
MKSNKKEDKKQDKRLYARFDNMSLLKEDDMIIEENKDHKQVNMTDAFKKLLGIKSTKKKEK